MSRISKLIEAGVASVLTYAAIKGGVEDLQHGDIQDAIGFFAGTLVLGGLVIADYLPEPKSRQTKPQEDLPISANPGQTDQDQL